MITASKSSVVARVPLRLTASRLGVGVGVGRGLGRLACALSVSFALTMPVQPWLSSTAIAGPAKPAAVAATDGKTVAVMRFSGTSGTDLRTGIVSTLEEKGWTLKSVALDIAGAATKVKCKGEAGSAQCLETIGKWLNSNPKTAADYIIHGRYVAGTPNRAEVVVYHIPKNTIVRSFDLTLTDGDLIGPVMLPQALVTSMDEYLSPPPPITDEEWKVLAQLDEPDKTQEEMDAEKKAIADAEQAAAQAAAKGVEIDTENIPVDLKADFKDFCRTGPRNKRKSREDPKDLRPACKRGPFWGYWQPRAWVAMGLTIGAGIGTIAFYSAALAARGPYKDSVDALDGYLADVGGDPRRDPQFATNGDQSYDALATEVSRTGSVVRSRALIGDVLLGTSVLLAGVLTIIIFQDRTDAKNYIKQEKGLRAISKTIRVAPLMTRQGGGLGFGLSF